MCKSWNQGKFGVFIPSAWIVQAGAVATLCSTPFSNTYSTQTHSVSSSSSSNRLKTDGLRTHPQLLSPDLSIVYALHQGSEVVLVRGVRSQKLARGLDPAQSPFLLKVESHPA